MCGNDLVRRITTSRLVRDLSPHASASAILDRDSVARPRLPPSLQSLYPGNGTLRLAVSPRHNSPPNPVTGSISMKIIIKPPMPFFVSCIISTTDLLVCRPETLRQALCARGLSLVLPFFAPQIFDN